MSKLPGQQHESILVVGVHVLDDLTSSITLMASPVYPLLQQVDKRKFRHIARHIAQQSFDN